MGLDLTSTKKTVIIFGILLAVLFVLIGGLVAYSKNYNSFYKFPTIDNQTLDLDGVSYEDSRTPIRLTGEWDFFYNKWIISDDEADTQPDGTIAVPGKWSGKKIGEKTLPRNGYASYRLTLKNPKIGDKIVVCNNYCDIAFRVFINRTLCFQTGTLSKDESKTVTTGEFDYACAYEVQSANDLDVVVEVSANDDGGMYKAPLVASERLYSSWNSINWDSNFLTYIVIGVCLLLIAFAVATAIVFKDNSYGVLSIFFLLSLFVHYLTTIDAFPLICRAIPFVEYSWLLPLSLASALVYFAILILFFERRLFTKKRLALNLSVALVNVLSIALFLAFCGVQYSALILLPCALTLLFYLWAFASDVASKQRLSVVKTIIYVLSIYTLILEVSDNIGLFDVGSRTIYNYFVLVLCLLIFVVVLLRLKDISNIVVEKKQMDDKIENIKNKKIKEEFISGKLSETKSITICAFGHFNVFVDGTPVVFKSAKSKELVALLVDKQGGELTMSEIITRLYPDKDEELAKKSYRDVIIKLRLALDEFGISELVTIGRAKVSLNRNVVANCDVWEYFESPKEGVNVDEYMLSYDWATERIAELQVK